MRSICPVCGDEYDFSDSHACAKTVARLKAELAEAREWKVSFETVGNNGDVFVNIKHGHDTLHIQRDSDGVWASNPYVGDKAMSGRLWDEHSRDFFAKPLEESK